VKDLSYGEASNMIIEYFTIYLLIIYYTIPYASYRETLSKRGIKWHFG